MCVCVCVSDEDGVGIGRWYTGFEMQNGNVGCISGMGTGRRSLH